MALPARHLLAQGRVIAALGRTAVSALSQRLLDGAGDAVGPLPGPELRATVRPPSAALVRDYVRNVGGDPAAYRAFLPPHLFPQWAFPLASRTLQGLPYPILKIVNGGCRLAINGRLPIGEPLQVRAQLVAIEEHGRRAILRQRIVTGTASEPDLLVAEIDAFVPVPNGAPATNGSNGHGARGSSRKEAVVVPCDARELWYGRLSGNAGLSFAMLTGDVNPLHWLRPYARAMGFRTTILHGFATMARAMEGLTRALFAGDVRRLAAIEVRFSRPLALPARVGLYLGEGNTITVGDAPCGPAYLTGTFTERKSIS